MKFLARIMSVVLLVALAACGGGQPTQTGEIKVWDLETGAEVWSVTPHSDTVLGLDWSADGARLLTGAADRVTDPKGTLEFTGAAPHEKARFFTYRDAYHEILNDPARDQVIKDIVGWLDLVCVM